MNPKSKFLIGLDFWQKLAHFECQPVAFIVSAGLIVMLIAAWVVTNPLFQLGDRLRAKTRVRTSKKLKRNHKL